MLYKIYLLIAFLSTCPFSPALAYEESSEMIEKGRTQYQLLREKSNLPRYGSCWKSALEYVDDNCRNLSEDTQSDMALHLTNCFLEMSGHETYNCELDKKPNLRGICVRSMSDRGFNVYTEFYTHVQNICWFLRGQIWYDTITENSFKVGKQLEASAKNQEELLGTQKESMDLQKRILENERLLEEVLGDLYTSAQSHKEVLKILSLSLLNFQSWAIGEVSWLDSVIFYLLSLTSIFVFTSTKRTSTARLPLLLCLVLTFILERFISFILISQDVLIDTNLLYQRIYFYAWCVRCLAMFIMLLYFIHQCLSFRDIHVENNKVLQDIVQQNSSILDLVQSISRNITGGDNLSLLNEKDEFNESNSSFSESLKGRKSYSSRPYVPLIEVSHIKYNLRSSRQNTPDVCNFR